MLHVADDRVVPVSKVDRAFRPHINKDGAEVWIARGDQIFQRLAFEAGTFLSDFDAVNSLEADDVDVQEIVLEFFGEMTAGGVALVRRWFPTCLSAKVGCNAVSMKLAGAEGRNCC